MKEATKLDCIICTILMRHNIEDIRLIKVVGNAKNKIVEIYQNNKLLGLISRDLKWRIIK